MIFSSGDFRFFWLESFKYLAHSPQAWDSSLNTGIGIPSVNTLWITSYLNITSYFSYFGLSWFYINILFWIIPTILITFFSSFYLLRYFIPKKTIYQLIGATIYTSNTYFLSLFFGGQQGVSFSYAITPLSFLIFFKLIEKPNLNRSLLAGLIFALQVLFDPRIAFLSFFSFFVFYLIRFIFSFKEVIYVILIPSVIVLLLHSYWILPLIISRQWGLPLGYGSLPSAEFFSFAFFENAISLLHPNWPENIFGKIYFLKSEFLLIPVIAYSSLFFIGKEKKTKKLLFVFIILGSFFSVFFAKGTNQPFGEIFLWMFKNIPIFSFFRDPTKFYILTALFFSILIPYSLYKFTDKFKQKILEKIICFLFIAFWLFTIRSLFDANLNFFTFKKVPQSYSVFKDFIFDQHKSFRTLWIPSWQRYGFFSDENPALGRNEIFSQSNSRVMIKELGTKRYQDLLKQISVKYVIVPEDTEEEIFLTDRKYDNNKYNKTVDSIKKISFLKKIAEFGKIIVFENQDYNNRFYSLSGKSDIDYEYLAPTKYKLNIRNAQKGDVIIFSESFDSYWQARGQGFKMESSRFNGRLNSFKLPNDGNYTFEVYYSLQDWVNVGMWISLTSFVVILGSLVIFRKKNV